MIQNFPTHSRTDCLWLLNSISESMDHDFYYTKDNNRIYITDLKSLRGLFRESVYVYAKQERGDYLGVIMVWKSLGAGVKRYYVKVNAKDKEIARDLLTVLLWNCPKELFIKIRKDNKFLSVFKEKGFRFNGERGVQLLLNRKPIIYQKVFKQEDPI